VNQSRFRGLRDSAYLEPNSKPEVTRLSQGYYELIVLYCKEKVSVYCDVILKTEDKEKMEATVDRCRFVVMGSVSDPLFAAL